MAWEAGVGTMSAETEIGPVFLLAVRSKRGQGWRGSVLCGALRV